MKVYNICSIIAYRNTALLLYGDRRVSAAQEISPNTPWKDDLLGHVWED
jgi:hypothetical protein